MGDLSEKQAGGNSKIVGANPTTGEETFFLDVTSEGEAKISSFANVTFIDAVKTITTVEQLAAVGGSNLANRKSVVISNLGPQTVYYGSTGVLGGSGPRIAIEKDELIELEVGDNIMVYLITSTSTADVTIQEFA